MNSKFIKFDNTYAALPERFYIYKNPTPVTTPNLVYMNESLSKNLGIDPNYLKSKDGIHVLSGNNIAKGSQPISMVYAGHQFGHWVPKLGDGRAVLLGEVMDLDNKRFDIQLKGSGPTPFSRNGDGRAWIGPVLREYIVSEYMHAVGIPTTRALAVVSTGEDVFRETKLPGAVLTRVARSHVRVGTFQYFASTSDLEAIKVLADYIINRDYNDLLIDKNPYLSLLESLIKRQAKLVAEWMGVGFIHGVMNTDNMSIVGDTIDYGPCAFMDSFSEDMVFSSIDQMGRYSYKNQPYIANWNLMCFANTILPLIDINEKRAIKVAQEKIDSFSSIFEDAWCDVFRKKIGLKTKKANDVLLAKELLNLMEYSKSDFTKTFRALSFLNLKTDDNYLKEFYGQFINKDSIDKWLEKWKIRQSLDSSNIKSAQLLMMKSNPVYIPRNHIIEKIISSALYDNYKPFYEFMNIITNPYKELIDKPNYASPPKPDEIVSETFCGT